MGSFEYQSLDQIVVECHRARAWFESVGIRTGGSRLEAIQRYLDESLSPGTLSGNPFNADPNGVEAFHALNDAAGFGRIVKGFSLLPSHLLPRRALKDALRGPFRLSDEGHDSSSDARNKFVELELAASCLKAGLRVTGFDDVRFWFEGAGYLVECKRPLHQATMRSSVAKAYEQLRAKLGEQERGVVALAVDRVLGFDRTFQEANSESDFRKRGVEAARDCLTSLDAPWLTWTDPRVVSVAVVVRFLAKARKSELVAYSYQVALLKVASEQGQPAEGARLDRLADVLAGRGSA